MSEPVAAALRAAAARLGATSDTARLDAEVLMAHELGVSRSELLLRHMQTPAPPGFPALVERRAGHEPVAYITGRQEFYGLDLQVGPGVLIPRGDSETLIEAARMALANRPPRRILDIGTGSGALLLAAASLWPAAEAIGLDRSPTARAIAAGNGVRLRLAAEWRAADWTSPGWTEGLGRFDLVLCNPPYVETAAELAPSVRGHEPAEALFAGAEGLDDYRILLPQLPGLLAAQGIALFEIGHAQAEAVTAIAVAAGFAVRLHRDLADRPRALELSLPASDFPLAFAQAMLK